MPKNKIVICIGSSCYTRGNAKNVEITEKFLEDHHLKDDIDIDISGGLCMGHCADGPNVMINEKLHNHVDSGVMLDLLNELYPEK